MITNKIDISYETKLLGLFLSIINMPILLGLPELTPTPVC
jgi:hypothetical protein